jgi:hypothetical protein
MRIPTVMVLVLAAAGGCRGVDPRHSRGEGEAQIVVLVVRSEPPGAQVRVNKIAKSWTTPCDVADYSLAKGPIDVEVSLAGYQTVVTKVRYDGNDPVQMNVRLLRIGAAPAAAVAPAVAPPPASEPKIVTTLPEPAAVEAVPQVTAVPAGGGTVLRVNSTNAKLRIQAKSVVTDAAKPGEYYLPNVPPDKVLVEFLDPRTDMVMHTVEFEAGVAAPAAVVRPAEPLPPAADRLGEVKVVSKTYGVYVKLDPGLDVQPGEEIIIYREGREVARTKILRIAKADSGYPDGAAQVQKEGSIQKGDEVRRSKP